MPPLKLSFFLAKYKVFFIDLAEYSDIVITEVSYRWLVDWGGRYHLLVGG
jgi:hypothetical protein